MTRQQIRALAARIANSPAGQKFRAQQRLRDIGLTEGKAILNREFDISGGLARPGPLATFNLQQGPGGLAQVSFKGRLWFGNVGFDSTKPSAPPIVPADTNYRPPTDEKFDFSDNYSRLPIPIHPLMGGGLLSYMIRMYRQYRFKNLRFEYIPTRSGSADGAMWMSSSPDAGTLTSYPVTVSKTPGATASVDLNQELLSTPGTVILPFRIPATYAPNFSREWKHTQSTLWNLGTASFTKQTEAIVTSLIRETCPCVLWSGFIASSAPTTTTSFGVLMMYYEIEARDMFIPAINPWTLPRDGGDTDPCWVASTASAQTSELAGSIPAETSSLEHKDPTGTSPAGATSSGDFELVPRTRELRRKT